MNGKGRFERTSRIVKRRVIDLFSLLFCCSPNFQLFQINFWHFPTIAARQWRRKRRLTWRRRDGVMAWRRWSVMTRRRNDVRVVDVDRDRRNIGVGTRRSRNLDLRRKRIDAEATAAATRSSSVKASRKFSDIWNDVSGMASQIRRHFWRRRRRRR